MISCIFERVLTYIISRTTWQDGRGGYEYGQSARLNEKGSRRSCEEPQADQCSPLFIGCKLDTSYGHEYDRLRTALLTQ